MGNRICIGPECNAPAKCKGLCKSHYSQQLKGRELTPVKTRGAPNLRAPGEPGCLVEDCERKFMAKGLCYAHYAAMRRGRPLLPATQERLFFSRVVDDGGCWHWDGVRDRKGYGLFSVEGKQVFAHRWAYEFMRGEIPEGLQLDHLCRNRACVNPDHLEPVPRAVNILRGVSPTAINARKTHCIHGHEFTPENTYVRPSTGYRQCRKCNKEHQKKAARTRRE